MEMEYMHTFYIEREKISNNYLKERAKCECDVAISKKSKMLCTKNIRRFPKHILK